MRYATVASSRTLPAARVLAARLAEHAPGAGLTALVLDAPPDGPEPFDVVVPAQLGLPLDEVGRIAGLSLPAALAHAFTPLLLAHLLAAAPEPVCVLATHVVVVGALDALEEALADAPVVLVDRLPRTADAEADRVDIVTGTWSVDVLAVRAGAEPFLAWWARRIGRGPLTVAPGAGDRWLDQAFPKFATTRLASPATAVNVHAAAALGLREAGDGYALADGAAVGAVVVGPGFDPRAPYALPPVPGLPGCRPSRVPAVGRLAREHAQELLDAGWARARTAERPWARLPSGLAFDETMRRLYHDAVLRADVGTAPMPPTPFTDEEGFLAWLREPADRRHEAIGVPRYVDGLRFEFPELQQRFGDLTGPAAEGLRRHLEVHDPGVPPALASTGLRPGPPPVPGPFELRPGVVLAGDGGSELVRGLERGLAATPLEVVRVAWSPGTRTDVADADGSDADRDVNLLALAPDWLGSWEDDLGALLRPWRYQVGVWERPPVLWRVLGLVDEIWSPWPSTAAAVREHAELPVLTFPFPVGPDALAGTVAADRSSTVAIPLDLAVGVDVVALRATLDAVVAAGAAPLVLVQHAGAALVEAEAVHAWTAAAGGRAVEPATRAEAVAEVAGCAALAALGAAAQGAPLIDAAALGVAVCAPRDGFGSAAEPAFAATDPAGLREVLPHALAASAAERRGQADAVRAHHGPEALGRWIAARLDALAAAGTVPVGPRGERPRPVDADVVSGG